MVLTIKLLPAGNVKCLRFRMAPNDVFTLGHWSVAFEHSPHVYIDIRNNNNTLKKCMFI